MNKDELKDYSYFGIHNHTYYSNMRLKDAITSPKDLADKALELGLKGICLTDHEVLSGHMKLTDYVRNNPQFKGFKVGLGNEIYLVDKEKLDYCVEHKEKMMFNHFLLVAKNLHGHELLRKQSSRAWENDFKFRSMERVPTYYNELEELMKDYKGDVIASSSCLGGALPQLILEYVNNRTEETHIAIDKYINWCIQVFGIDDFYFELQPSHQEDQLIVNEWLIKLSKIYNIKLIVTTDTHYATKEQKLLHKTYLQSQNGDREVDSFYDTTYLFAPEDLLEFFSEELLTEMFINTHEIMDKIEEYTINHEMIIPKAHIPIFNRLKPSTFGDISKYPSIQNYMNTDNQSDLYYIYLIHKGMIDKNQPINDETLSRIDVELSELWAISEHLKQPMSGYFLVMREFVDVMWETSLVGVSRGSASCFYTNYLLDIVQINAIKYDLPHWRFLTKDRLDSMPDKQQCLGY